MLDRGIQGANLNLNNESKDAVPTPCDLSHGLNKDLDGRGNSKLRKLRNMSLTIHQNHTNQNILFRKVFKPIKTSIDHSKFREGMYKNLKPFATSLYFEIFSVGAKKRHNIHLMQCLPGTSPLFLFNELLQELKSKLSSSQQYRVGPQINLTPTSAYRDNSHSIKMPQFVDAHSKFESRDHLQSETHEPLNREVVRMATEYSPDKILRWCTESRQSSMAFQLLLQKFDKDDKGRLQEIISVIIAALEYLLVDRYGSYVLGKLLSMGTHLAKIIEKRALKDWPSLVHNEYSSRVLQGLFQVSETFRNFCRASLESSPHEVINSIPSIFFTSTAIRQAAQLSDPTAFIFLLTPLERSSQSLDSKYFKRVLVSLAETLPISKLDYMYSLLTEYYSIQNCLDDKYLTYIVLMLLQRNYKAAIEDLFYFLREFIVELFNTKFFGFLITKMIEKRDQNCEFVLRLNGVLRTDLERLFGLVRTQASMESRYFYAYVLLSTLEDCGVRVVDNGLRLELGKGSDLALSALHA